MADFKKEITEEDLDKGTSASVHRFCLETLSGSNGTYRELEKERADFRLQIGRIFNSLMNCICEDSGDFADNDFSLPLNLAIADAQRDMNSQTYLLQYLKRFARKYPEAIWHEDYVLEATQFLSYYGAANSFYGARAVKMIREACNRKVEENFSIMFQNDVNSYTTCMAEWYKCLADGISYYVAFETVNNMGGRIVWHELSKRNKKMQNDHRENVKASI